MFTVSNAVINRDALIKSVEDPSAGAIVVFSGVVRNNAEGKSVLRMEYEAHQSMAEEMLEVIAHEIKEHHAVCKISIQHRTGLLEIGEESVFIAVSSPHRREGFQACEDALNILKKKLPVWKKEFFKDGTRWVEGHIVD